MLFTSLGQSVLGKTVPTVLSTARGRGLANNVYLFDATSATPKPT